MGLDKSSMSRCTWSLVLDVAEEFALQKGNFRRAKNGAGARAVGTAESDRGKLWIQWNANGQTAIERARGGKVTRAGY